MFYRVEKDAHDGNYLGGQLTMSDSCGVLGLCVLLGRTFNMGRVVCNSTHILVCNGVCVLSLVVIGE